MVLTCLILIESANYACFSVPQFSKFRSLSDLEPTVPIWRMYIEMVLQKSFNIFVLIGYCLTCQLGDVVPFVFLVLVEVFLCNFVLFFEATVDIAYQHLLTPFEGVMLIG